MTKKQTFHEMGDMAVYFISDEGTGQMGFGFVPSASKGKIVEGRANFEEDAEIMELPEEWRPTVPRGIFPIAQVRCAGDAANEGPFGRSMVNAQTGMSFSFLTQQVIENNGGKEIITKLKAKNGLVCCHKLIYKKDQQRITLQTTYENSSDEEITLELASSFSFSDLSPFDETCSHDRLFLHRFKTFWSREGRHVTDSINDLQMFPSWHVAHLANEKFGQVGTWSTNGWYPQLVLEDKKENVFWAVRLAWSGSWQMELWRNDDQLNIAGGLADYDFGHWKKKLKPGEKFSVPDAYLTVCDGDVEEACSRLVENPEEKNSLENPPIVFNDWCTNWGEPSEESVKSLAASLKPIECDYLIIDAGWYKPDTGNWNQAHGDWNPNKNYYPNGLKNAADIIKKNGLKPGIWFEYETVGLESDLFKRTDLMLHSDGKPIQVGARRFLDFRKKEVIEYLDEKVIDTLNNGGFEYMKIDYNSSIGKGADGSESLGESLRQHLIEVGKFLERIKEKVPGIMIEDCASGGMRLDPYTLSKCDFGSFSDAHASPEIPIIAANLHRLIHPAKSLVWAVLRAEESTKRIHYSMAATFLGSPCLSGDIDRLDEKQMSIVDNYLKSFRKIGHIITDGKTRILGPKVDNYRKAKNFQVVMRENENSSEALLVCHSFELTLDNEISIPVSANTSILESISEGVSTQFKNGNLTISFQESWVGGIVHLELK